MISRISLLVMIALLAGGISAHAQEPLSFKDFSERVGEFFAPELIQDIRDGLPQTPYDIWGYDVGDFSGDENLDVAVSLYQRNSNKKRVGVYFFVDDEGTLRLIKQQSVEFVELPIEVGVAISKGNVYMTKKLREFQWEIYGYRYLNGVVMMADKFVTERQGNVVHEAYRNFLTLEGYERYIDANSETNDQLFRGDFLSTPAYLRGRDISTGYKATARADMSKYITGGSYFWKSDTDLAVNTRSAYDQEFLYFNIFVQDDEVVPVGVDNIDTTADRLELWLDMYSLGNRFRGGGRRARDFRMKADTNIYAFSVTLGDFYDVQPRVKISSSNILDESQTLAAKRIKAVAAQGDGGYTVKIRIPFGLLGFSAPPFEDSTAASEFGMTTVIHDVDNPYRAEETTTMATSQNFQSTKPATFGSVVLIPEGDYYGESINIFLGEIRERLREIGL